MIASLKESLLALLYPHSCLHCASREIEPPRPLCNACNHSLALIRGDGRCKRCFAIIEAYGSCSQCRLHPLPITASAAAFDYEGAAATLVRSLKYGSLYYLADAMGAFMAAQIIAEDWPWPDYIVPVPLSAARWIGRGYNQSALLAQSIASILGRPLYGLLGRYSGDYSQAGLSREQRMALDRASFTCCDIVDIEEKKILLVDDVMTTGRTLGICAGLLREKKPEAIYSIAFCRALE